MNIMNSNVSDDKMSQSLETTNENNGSRSADFRNSDTRDGKMTSNFLMSAVTDLHDPFRRRLSSDWSHTLKYECMEKAIVEDRKLIDPSLVLGQIQSGIEHSLMNMPDELGRDLLMTDFAVVDITRYKRIGPKPEESGFTFRNHAPIAFWFFRELFGISNDVFRRSLCVRRLRKIKECGNSGSAFYKTYDDKFILKTVQKKEAVFLRKMLPGYYLNLTQHGKTLLPKYFGLYDYQKNTKAVSLLVMNNLLPSSLDIEQVYDLKGSTHKRRTLPTSTCKTKKDLDFLDDHPHGFYMEKKLYKLIMKSIERDCDVLLSHKIMDYSLLLGVQHFHQCLPVHSTTSRFGGPFLSYSESSCLNKGSTSSVRNKKTDNLIGPFEARNSTGGKMFLYFGIIDILQKYDKRKRFELCLKSLVLQTKTISVQEPKYYSKRFTDFIKSHVIKCIPQV